MRMSCLQDKDEEVHRWATGDKGPGRSFVYEADGQIYNHHAITFPEEVPYLANLKIKDKDCTDIISSTQPIHIENFVKFIREKYRLCWKEIYLKISSTNFLAEKCKKCNQWFQLSGIGGCTDYDFHEIDYDLSTNQFSKTHYLMYKEQIQVINNLPLL
jgi:hypothetical protein